MFKNRFSILFVLVLVVFLAGCSEYEIDTGNPDKVPVENGQTPDSSTKTFPDNKFKLEDVKPGDKIGDMTILSIGAFSANMEAPAKNLPMSIDNVIIKYKGEVEVSGDYRYYKEGEGIIADIVCMDNLDSASIAKLPKVEGSQKTNYLFCFSNDSEAKKQFGPAGSSGKATVVIADYVNVYYPAAGWDTARLVKVVKK